MHEGLDLKRSAAAAESLANACDRRGSALILIQNEPDPDALGSAAALRAILMEKLGKRAIIGYGGACGRAENAAMMRTLHIDARRVTANDAQEAATICLVDTQPRSGNNILPAERMPDVLIDHHLLPRRRTWKAVFEDIRPSYGATSTILYEYLLAMGIPISTPLATALFYGIQSDTQDLGREVSGPDVTAFQELFFLADKRKLSKIYHAPVGVEYFQTLDESLTHCLVAGKTVISRIDAQGTPDMMAEIADLMLRLEGITMSVCYGFCGDSVRISARSRSPRNDVAQRIKRAVMRIGTGGGHRTMAGGQVPLTGMDPAKRLAQVGERILKAFAPKSEPRPLLERPGSVTPKAKPAGRFAK